MICEKCKTPVADTSKFCPKCGNKIESIASNAAIKKCPQCGAENPASAKFCKVDGYNFQQTDAEKPIEKPVEAAKPKDTVLCPKCGTPYDVGVKFCKKDGASLQEDSTSKKDIEPPAQNIEPIQSPVALVRSENKKATEKPKGEEVSPRIESDIAALQYRPVH